MPAKTQFFETFSEIHPTKRENVFESLNYISSVTWAVSENPNFRIFVISFAGKHVENLKFCCSFLFENCADSMIYVPQKRGTSKNSKEKLEENQNLSARISQKPALFNAALEEISAETALFDVDS